MMWCGCFSQHPQLLLFLFCSELFTGCVYVSGGKLLSVLYLDISFVSLQVWVLMHSGGGSLSCWTCVDCSSVFWVFEYIEMEQVTVWWCSVFSLEEVWFVKCFLCRDRSHFLFCRIFTRNTWKHCSSAQRIVCTSSITR